MASAFIGRNISIHAPREGSDATGANQLGKQLKISIHAPREGSDNTTGITEMIMSISIHAPREGSDPQGCGHVHGATNFNPRSP